MWNVTYRVLSNRGPVGQIIFIKKVCLSQVVEIHIWVQIFKILIYRHIHWRYSHINGLGVVIGRQSPSRNIFNSAKRWGGLLLGSVPLIGRTRYMYLLLFSHMQWEFHRVFPYNKVLLRYWHFWNGRTVHKFYYMTDRRLSGQH